VFLVLRSHFIAQFLYLHKHYVTPKLANTLLNNFCDSGLLKQKVKQQKKKLYHSIGRSVISSIVI